MKARTVLTVGLVAVGCAVASVIVVRHRKAGVEPAGNQARRAAAPVPVAAERLSPEGVILSSDGRSQARLVKADDHTNTGTQAATAIQAGQAPRLTDLVVKEQWGRLALSFVGTDPCAEEVWIETINDPSLSADARQNLIEDLNEDGLSDPRNPSVYDLPLIENRLWLIEQLAPYAMDEVNADAFAEAYKDLVNMWLRLNGR
jgi:hypothetical protein